MARGGTGRAKAAATDHHTELAKAIGTDITEMLHEALPEAAEGVKGSARQASVTFTIALRETGTRKTGKHLVAQLDSRVRSPKPGREYQIHVDETTGQLALGFAHITEPAQDDRRE